MLDYVITNAITTAPPAPSVTEHIALGDMSAQPDTAFNTKTVTVDMSSHNGTDDIVIIFGGLASSIVTGPQVASMTTTLDGNAGTIEIATLTTGTNQPFLVVASFAGAAFSATSSLVLANTVGSWFNVNADVFSRPSITSVRSITSLPSATRAGSTLTGNTVSGEDLLAAQITANGSAVAAWTGITGVSKTDIRSDEYFDTGLATNVAAETPRAVSITGTSVQTSALLLGIA